MDEYSTIVGFMVVIYNLFSSFILFTFIVICDVNDETETIYTKRLTVIAIHRTIYRLNENLVDLPLFIVLISFLLFYFSNKV